MGKTGSVNTRLSAMQLTAKAASDMKYIIEEAKRSNATEYAIYQNAMTDIDSFIKVHSFCLTDIRNATTRTKNP